MMFLYMQQLANTLRPRQSGCNFAEDIFKCLSLNENVRISIKIPLKFVANDLINYIPALVQITSLALTKQQAIIWTNDAGVWWGI